MASQPNRPGTNSEIDDETRRILDERLLTIDVDRKNSFDRESSREEIRRLREALKQPVLR